MKKKSEKTRLKFDSDNDFLDIRACGKVEPHADYSAGRIPDGYYGVNGTFSGRAYMKCEDSEFRLSSGDILFIPRGAQTDFQGDPQHPVEKYWMIFRGRLVDSLFGLFLPDGLPMAENSAEACSALRYIVEGMTSGTLSEREISHALFDMFAFAFRKDERDDELAGEILQVLERHITKNITIHDLEKHFCLSGKTLEREFAARFDTTIYRYLRDRRFAAACRDLRLSDLPISAIREKYRLGTGGYFSACFKESFGMTPGEYRERFRKSSTLTGRREEPVGNDQVDKVNTIYDYLPVTDDYD